MDLWTFEAPKNERSKSVKNNTNILMEPSNFPRFQFKPFYYNGKVLCLSKSGLSLSVELPSCPRHFNLKSIQIHHSKLTNQSKSSIVVLSLAKSTPLGPH
jgi:hypothetical protein